MPIHYWRHIAIYAQNLAVCSEYLDSVGQCYMLQESGREVYTRPVSVTRRLHHRHTQSNRRCPGVVLGFIELL